MDDRQLGEALVWLYATDCGLVGPAGHEHALRGRCRQGIWDRLVTDDVELRRWLSRLVRDVFLSETALASGHGIDDACEFWTWFDQTMWTLAPARRKEPPQARCLSRPSTQRQPVPSTR
jgi:hypothetical protein